MPVLKLLNGLFDEADTHSVKPIVALLGGLSAIAISWYAIVYAHDITTNELILVLGIAGLSVGQYLEPTRLVPGSKQTTEAEKEPE